MKKCPKCGAEITEKDANACSDCGVWLADVGGAVEVEEASAVDVTSSAESDMRLHDEIPADFETAKEAVSEPSNGVAADGVTEEDAAGGLEDEFWGILDEIGKIDTICEDVEKDIPSDKEIEAEISKEIENVNNSDDSMPYAAMKNGGNNHQAKGPSPDGKNGGDCIFGKIPDEGPSECGCLLVEYNWNSFSIENMQNYLSFRLTPLAVRQGDRSDFMLRQVNFYYWIVRNPTKVNYVPIPPLWGVLKENKPFEVPVPIMEPAGIYNISFKVECITDSGKELYGFQQKHYVFAKEQDSTFSSVINIGDIQASEAGDVKLDLNAFANKRLSDKLEELAKLPPAYGRKALYEMVEGASANDSAPANNNSLDFILLHVAGYNLYVVGKSSMKIGRFKKWETVTKDHKIIRGTSDLLIRKPELSTEDWPNSTVSSTHGILSFAGRTLSYQDASSFGTMINGGDWLVRKQQELPCDKVAVMGVGEIYLDLEPCACAPRKGDAMCKDCVRMPGSVCSAVLRHQENVSEGYLMIQGCCDLGKVLPLLDKWILYKTKDGFEVRKPDGSSCRLTIGERVIYGGVTMDVEEFRQ